MSRRLGEAAAPSEWLELEERDAPQLLGQFRVDAITARLILCGWSDLVKVGWG
jgi:hypothetical protein